MENFIPKDLTFERHKPGNYGHGNLQQTDFFKGQRCEVKPFISAAAWAKLKRRYGNAQVERFRDLLLRYPGIFDRFKIQAALPQNGVITRDHIAQLRQWYESMYGPIVRIHIRPVNGKIEVNILPPDGLIKNTLVCQCGNVYRRDTGPRPPTNWGPCSGGLWHAGCANMNRWCDSSGQPGTVVPKSTSSQSTGSSTPSSSTYQIINQNAMLVSESLTSSEVVEEAGAVPVTVSYYGTINSIEIVAEVNGETVGGAPGSIIDGLNITTPQIIEEDEISYDILIDKYEGDVVGQTEYYIA